MVQDEAIIIIADQ